MMKHDTSKTMKLAAFIGIQKIWEFQVDWAKAMLFMPMEKWLPS